MCHLKPMSPMLMFFFTTMKNDFKVSDHCECFRWTHGNATIMYLSLYKAYLRLLLLHAPRQDFTEPKKICTGWCWTYFMSPISSSKLFTHLNSSWNIDNHFYIRPETWQCYMDKLQNKELGKATPPSSKKWIELSNNFISYATDELLQILQWITRPNDFVNLKIRNCIILRVRLSRWKMNFSSSHQFWDFCLVLSLNIFLKDFTGLDVLKI